MPYITAMAWAGPFFSRHFRDTSYTAAFQIFFIDISIAIFVIIIYIPYTCLSVCYKRVLCLRYD